MDGANVFDSGWGMTSIHQVRFSILGFTVDHSNAQPQSFRKWLGPVQTQTQNSFSTFLLLLLLFILFFYVALLNLFDTNQGTNMKEEKEL